MKGCTGQDLGEPSVLSGHAFPQVVSILEAVHAVSFLVFMELG